MQIKNGAPGGPAVVVKDVSKMFRIYHERNQSIKATLMRGRRARYDEFWALKDVNLEIASGQTFGDRKSTRLNSSHLR